MDSSTSISTDPPKRGGIWFEDGNVVLQAQSTQFRVHRGVLSANSPVFADLFTLPQPANEKLIEGCPIVHLSDSVEDLSHILEALYNQNSYVLAQQSQPFSVTAAFVRLGKKYDIRQLLAEGIDRLSSDFPSKLEEWDAGLSRPNRVVSCPALHFDVINLARETRKLDFILPAVFYRYYSSSFNPLEIFEGITRDDGTNSILSPADQRMCILGWYALIEKQATHTFQWTDDVIPQCHNQYTCRPGRREIRCTISRPIPSCLGLSLWDPAWDVRLCATCVLACKMTHRNGRINIWTELPSIFGLPDWDELLKE